MFVNPSVRGNTMTDRSIRETGMQTLTGAFPVPNMI